MRSSHEVIQSPILVYDSKSQDVAAFESVEQAEANIEPNDIDDYLQIYDAAGRLLSAVPDWSDYSVQIGAAEAVPTHRGELHRALEEHCVASGVPPDWIASASTADLIETIRNRTT